MSRRFIVGFRAGRFFRSWSDTFHWACPSLCFIGAVCALRAAKKTTSIPARENSSPGLTAARALSSLAWASQRHRCALPRLAQIFISDTIAFKPRQLAHSGVLLGSTEIRHQSERLRNLRYHALRQRLYANRRSRVGNRRRLAAEIPQSNQFGSVQVNRMLKWFSERLEQSRLKHVLGFRLVPGNLRHRAHKPSAFGL